MLTDLGYEGGWHVLNSKHFGVPQNRERVFFIYNLRGERQPEIFSIGDLSTTFSDSEINIVGTTIGEHQTALGERYNVYGDGGVMGALTATDYKQPKQVMIAAQRGREDGQELEFSKGDYTNTLTSVSKDNYVVHNLQPRMGKGQGGKGHLQKSDGTTYCLDTGNGQAIEVKQINPSTESGGKQPYQHNRIYDVAGVMTTLDTDSGGRRNIQVTNQFHGTENQRNTVEALQDLLGQIGEEATKEWSAGIVDTFQQACLLWKSLYVEGVRRAEERTGGLDDRASSCEEKSNQGKLCEMWERTEFGCTPQGRELEEQLYSQFRSFVQKLPQFRTQSSDNLQSVWETTEGTWLLRNALSTIQEIWQSPYKKDKSTQPSARIRRLTPIETERLQGFSDNHTKYGNFDGIIKEMSDSARYKACGNAVTVNVIEALVKIYPFNKLC